MSSSRQQQQQQQQQEEEDDLLDRLGAQVHPPPVQQVPFAFSSDDFEPNNVFDGPTAPPPPSTNNRSTAASAGGGVPSTISFPAMDAPTLSTAGLLQGSSLQVPQALPPWPMAPIHRPLDASAAATAASVASGSGNEVVTHITLVQSHILDRRKQFLVFIKILLKQLETSSNLPTQTAVKQILQECTLKNRQGDPNFQPLHLAAESRILPVVGPHHWNRSVQYLNLYLKKQAQSRTLHANARIHARMNTGTGTGPTSNTVAPVAAVSSSSTTAPSSAL